MPITLSSKGQIVIPKRVRDAMGWKTGQMIEPVMWSGQVHLVPLVPLKDALGILGPPLDEPFVREKKDREF